LMEALKDEDCSLASYMIPWNILAMDEFPLTLNGKIDRKLLISKVQKSHIRDYIGGSLVTASSFTQQIICDIFQQLLKVDSIGIDCDFIDRGGHSLLVMQAVGKIREEFDMQSFTMRQFMDLKTARNIGQKIDDYERKKNSTPRRATLRRGSSLISILGSVVVGDGNLVRKVIVKAVAVFVLFISCGVAILPANILLSAALGLRVKSAQSSQYSTEQFSFLMLAIAAIVAATLAFFFCVAIIARLFGYLLVNIIGKGPTTIKRISATFGLWYVFDRLWFISQMGAAGMFRGTKFFAWFYKAYGCSIGRDNFFEDAYVRLPFMLTTGNNVVVETGAKLETLVIKKNGDIAVDEIVLGDNTVIGPNTHIGLGAKIGASCLIKSLSVVQQKRQIADSTVVMGHEVSELEPAAEGARNEFVEDKAVVSMGWHFLYLLISFIPVLMSILVSILMIFFLTFLKTHMIAVLIALYPIFFCIGNIIIALCMRPLRYFLIGQRAESGWERVYSKTFLRRNLATSLYHSSIQIFDGTVMYYLISRFVFGANIDVQSSFTPKPEEPDLTKIGVCTFGANGVRVRNTSFYYGGIVRYGQVKIGDHAMILDRAVISPDTSINEKVMVGPITSVDKETTQEEGILLLGTPALCLNRKVAEVAMNITSEPMVST